MQSSVPELTDICERAGVDLRSSTATRRRSPARSPTSALLARRMVERGVRFVQIYHNNWDTHANVAGPAARPVPRRRSGLLGLDPGPQAARLARRDAGHLGRRVRPHDLLARRTVEGELRPRPSSALLHDVDGRRRFEGRHGLRRNRRLLATTSSKTRSTSATSTPRSCICWASTTSDLPSARKGWTSD